MLRVAIIHPWFPQYRASFFEKIIHQAESKGISVDIYHGSPPPEWGERGDSVSAPYAVPLPTKFIRLGTKSLVVKSLRPLKKRGPYDLVIVEQAVRNLETYRLLLGRYRHRIAFWGHGRTYTEPAGANQEALKRWLTLRGKWFFSYTEGGIKAVVAMGFDVERTTLVQNSIDTKQLYESINKISQDDIDALRIRLDLHGKTALFMGGLDKAKRLPFLLQAAKLCHDTDPDFRLVVVGDGSERHVIEKAASENTWLRYLGRAQGTSKAQALAAAELMMMPGRVGLVAVDSFTAGLPIVTTDWSYHAPEFEYLQHGHNSMVTANDVTEYAAHTLSLLHDADRLDLMSRAAKASSSEYSIEKMTSNFRLGLEAALASPVLSGKIPLE